MSEAAPKIETEAGFEWIPPDRLSPSPTNPRKKFDGPEMDELTASIRVHGVLQPLVVRPKGEGFEIVAGERRFRAAKTAGLEVVPCMVRDLSDEDVLEIQIIENLQRQDLNPLEEARGFKIILDQGRLEIGDLAEKINVSAQYIGRRVAVLDLPEPMLEAWGEGRLKFGHLVQLARIRDEAVRQELFETTIEDDEGVSWEGGPAPVSWLREEVANLSPRLDKAPFKTSEAGCHTCSDNSEVQKTFLAPEDLAEHQKGIHCLNPKCYREKLLAWVEANRDKIIGLTGATGIRLAADFEWDGHRSFYRVEKPPAPCQECENLVVLIGLDGKPYQGKGAQCIGDAACHRKHDRAPRAGDDAGGDPAEDGNRRGRIGRAELDGFLQRAIMDGTPDAPADIQARLAVAALLAAMTHSYTFTDEVLVILKEEFDRTADDHERFWPEALIYRTVLTGPLEAVKKAYVRVVSWHAHHVGTNLLPVVAQAVGVDLARDWRMHEAYLKQLRKGELVSLGAEIGLWESQEFQVWQTEKKLPDQTKMKKGDLIRAFLESGFDLAGKVPREMVEAFREEPAEEAA